MPVLHAKPRHAKPREVPAARAVLVPVVLIGSTGTALSGLALSTAAAEQPVALAAAAGSSQASADQLELLAERRESAERRASRGRAAAAQADADRMAAEQAAAVKAAADKAAAAQAAQAAAERNAAAEAARTAAASHARPGTGGLTSSYGPRWGRMHRGIDLAAGTGTPIRAAAPGTVASAGWEGGYGRAVRIRHHDGTETLYAHNSRVLVGSGQRVAAGKTIAREGSTGNVTGPHLHFEVRVHGDSLDPLAWLRHNGVST